jgi:hypothetical protein
MRNTGHAIFIFTTLRHDVIVIASSEAFTHNFIAAVQRIF